MELTRTLSDLLDRKKAFFTQYESDTGALNTCAADDIEKYITNRTQLANEIDQIDEEIRLICEQAENGALLMSAIHNRCDYAAVPEDARCIFSAAQELFGIMSRIAALEPQIVERMQAMRAELLTQIKRTQNTPKIERYLSGLAGSTETGTYLGQKYDKI